MDSCTPEQAIKFLISSPSAHAFIDVRSEGEWLQGQVPGFRNFPILTNQERHEVGLTYRQLGQSQAIERGHALVGPIRQKRIEAWNAAIQNSPKKTGIIMCWRGGLRSKITCQWLTEVGATTMRVQDGYKAIRKQLTSEFIDANLPPLLVLTGWTGSGKTVLLRDLKVPKVDLEHLAVHRGSSFGRVWNAKQPTQATFENTLALEFRQQRGQTLLLEDESRAIGSIFLPKPLKEKMVQSEVVFIDETPEARVPHLFQEYVLEPLQQGQTAVELHTGLEAALLRVRDKLGGLKTQTIQKLMKTAFEEPKPDLDRHRHWILAMLVDYYDPLYTYSLSKRPRNVVFRGSQREVKEWISNRYASHKP